MVLEVYRLLELTLNNFKQDNFYELCRDTWRC